MANDVVFLGENDVLLKIACPAKEEHAGKTSVEQWYHADNCGKKMILNCDGHMRCTAAHRYPMINWRFSCSQHPGKYVAADFHSYTHALAVSMSYLSEGQSITWFTTLAKNLGTQYGRK